MQVYNLNNNFLNNQKFINVYIIALAIIFNLVSRLSVKTINYFLYELFLELQFFLKMDIKTFMVEIVTILSKKKNCLIYNSIFIFIFLNPLECIIKMQQKTFFIQKCHKFI